MILEAAAKAFERDGQAAVRVQPIARAVGLTDAAVHHHFGSRDGLLTALLKYAGRRVRAEVRATTATLTLDPEDLARVREVFSRWYAQRGYARLAMWLMLSGWKDEGQGMLAELVDTVHRARAADARAHGRQPPSLEHTRFIVALFHTITIADALFGASMRRSVGLGTDGATTERFQAWVLDVFHTLLTAPERQRRLRRAPAKSPQRRRRRA